MEEQEVTRGNFRCDRRRSKGKSSGGDKRFKLLYILNVQGCVNDTSESERLVSGYISGIWGTWVLRGE